MIGAVSASGCGATGGASDHTDEDALGTLSIKPAVRTGGGSLGGEAGAANGTESIKAPGRGGALTSGFSGT